MVTKQNMRQENITNPCPSCGNELTLHSVLMPYDEIEYTGSCDNCNWSEL